MIVQRADGFVGIIILGQLKAPEIKGIAGVGVRVFGGRVDGVYEACGNYGLLWRVVCLL